VACTRAGSLSKRPFLDGLIGNMFESGIAKSNGAYCAEDKNRRRAPNALRLPKNLRKSRRKTTYKQPSGEAK